MTTDIIPSLNPCEEFNGIDYLILSGFRALCASVSLFSCLLVIILILIFKRHHYFIQRLVLYVCIIAAINSIAIIIQKVDYFEPNETQANILDKYCIFVGFFELYTSLVELLSLLCITHGVYRCIIKQKPKKYLEGIYITASLLTPLLIVCVPFFGRQVTYGKSGPWCWIQERDQECTKNVFGIILQFTIWYIPLIVVTAITSIVYVSMLYSVRRSLENHWQGPYDPELFLHKGRLRKIVKIMLAYLPVLYLIVNLFSLPNAIYWAIGEKPIFALWVLHGVLPPLRGALFAIPYLFHTDTRRQIKQLNIRAAIKQQFVNNTHAISNYPAKECNFTDSLNFPASAETTYEHTRPYNNPSLRFQLSKRYSIPQVPKEGPLTDTRSENFIPSGLLSSRTAHTNNSEVESNQ